MFLITMQTVCIQIVKHHSWRYVPFWANIRKQFHLLHYFAFKGVQNIYKIYANTFLLLMNERWCIYKIESVRSCHISWVSDQKVISKINYTLMQSWNPNYVCLYACSFIQPVAALSVGYFLQLLYSANILTKIFFWFILICHRRQ